MDVFQWKSSTICYRRWGNGKELMIAFHGYGLDGTSFFHISESLLEKYTWIAIDLPYQGRTRWREPGILGEEELCLLIKQFLKHIGHTEKVNLLAYSIGGNYTLGLVHRAPELINKLILIAADGLKFKPMFWFITRTWLGRAFFKGFVVLPQPFFWLISLSRTLKIYPPRVLTFFYESIATRNKRAALMLRWISVSRILPSQKEVVRIINTHNVPVFLLFGKRDQVIPVKNAESFNAKLINSRLCILDQGHQLLTKQNAVQLEELIR
jgi:pimeloyl-ACP methyl ester carboxylesterase